MAYLLDVNDPTKLYTKTIDAVGQPSIKSYTLKEDNVPKANSDFVTMEMLEEVLEDKIEAVFKKYNNNQNNRSRNRNKNNQNREVDNE